MTEISLIQCILLFQVIGYVILSIFFKPDVGKRLYCGIFAFNGPSNLSKELCHLVLSNIKTIGMYNDERGGDNAGIAINNEILRTTGFEYKFKTLIEKQDINKFDPTVSSIIMGHSRRGSVGGKGHENAHPFEIYETKKAANWYMAGIHNGTIENWKELLENHGLDKEDFKNDSKTVLKILSRQRRLKKQKKYVVLEKYKGNGVFMWYFQDEPNILYVFKGAHKKYKSSVNFEEERPLFYYECPITRGIYFSSIKDPLLVIATDRNEVKNLVTNTVLKFKEGKLLKDEIIEIDRSEIYEFDYSNNYYNSEEEEHWRNRYGHYCGIEDNDRITPKQNSTIGYKNYASQAEMAKIAAEKRAKDLIRRTLPSDNSSVPIIPVSKVNDSQSSKSGKTIILGSEDTPLQNLAHYKGKLYREHGLYKHNGLLLNGEYIINKQTYEIHSPSKKNLLEQEHIFEIRYFYEGYMLKNKASLIDLQEMDKNYPNWKVDKAPYILSKYCSYPVPTFDGKFYYLNLNKFNGHLEGVPYSEDKSYLYKDGKLLEVKKLVKTSENVQSSLPFEGPTQEIDYCPIKVIDINSNKDISLDPELRPSLREIANQLEANEQEEENQENFLIFDASEREILDLWLQLREKVEEQTYQMNSYIKDKTFNEQDFLSGILHSWGFDCIEGGLTTATEKSPASERFVRDKNGKLIYQNISKLTFF